MSLSQIESETLSVNSASSTINFTEYDLANGLHVILAPMNNAAVVTTNLWYHVGSKDEDPARTGFAHLFEHMMFQGSRNVGKTEHFKYIQRAGGLLNASTSVDRTNYFQTVPSSELALALWLESDRMLTLDVAEENFENQRDVVKEEWRQRYVNRPYGLVWENLMRHVFPTSGYHWMTIGSMEHLDRSTIEEVRDFHSTYYKPNNCSLTVCGHFDEDHARELIDRYFGGIPRGTSISRVPQDIQPINGEVRLTLHDIARLPAVYLAWRGAPIYSDDAYTLDMLGHILDAGRSSRLYQELVYKRQIVREPETFNYSLELSGAFVMNAKVQPSSNVEEVESVLMAEIQKLQHELVSEHELQKVKNRVEMALVSSRSEQGKRADILQRGYIFKRNTSQINQDLANYRRVTPQDIQRAARTYLTKERFVAAHVLPK